MSPGAQRRVFGVVQGLLECDKDSSPSVQNDRVFRLTMTGLEPLAARPIGASAKKRRAAKQVKGGATAFIIRPCTGVRLDARPGQGRPRGGVWPTAKLPRAQRNTRKSLQLSLELLFVLTTCPEYRRRPAPGLSAAPAEPLAARPIGASAKIRAKVYNFRWNWIFVVAIPRAQKSTTFAGIAFCADHMPRI